MTVKKRLIFSNVLVILLSIIFILLVFFVTFLAFFSVVGVTVRDIEQRDGVANNIQTLSVHRIGRYCREGDPAEKEEIARKLKDQVAYFGFSSRRECDGVTIYTHLDADEEQFLSGHADLFAAGNAIAMENDAAAVVHYDSTVQGAHIRFDAVRLGSPEGSVSGEQLDSGEVSR